MPAPHRVHVDRPLADMAIAFVPHAKSVTGQILKPYRVANKTDDIWVYGNEAFVTRAPATGHVDGLIAPGAAYEAIEYDVSTTDAYNCRKYGKKILAPDEEDANYDSPALHRAVKAAIILEYLRSLYEQRGAALLFSATVFSGKTGGASALWDSSSADPYTDRITASESIKSNGKWNRDMCDFVCLIGEQAWERCKHNPHVIERMNLQGDRLKVTEAEWAAYLDVDKFIVGEGTYNSSKEGQTESLSYIWGDYALFAMVPKDNPGMNRMQLPSAIAPRLGATFVWPGPNSGAMPWGFSTTKWRDEERDAWAIKGAHHVDEAVFDTGAGYLLSNVTSA